MKLRADAKINLGLHIVAKRPDGYHNIETVFHQVDLLDEIDLLQTEEGTQFVCNSPGLSSDNSNLCVRAVNVMRDLTGIHTGVEITLKKRIPIAAGLGGGSADAAAVLQGLRTLWAIDITDEELRTVSATLGSDVPFFLAGGTAYATGRGEIIEPFDLPIPYWILVVAPSLHVSTSWAYAHLKFGQTSQRPHLPSLLRTSMNDPATLRKKLRNEFEPVVFNAYPEVRQIKESLLSGGAALALMSGSGSSVFGLFADETTTRRMAGELSPRYDVSITSPLFNRELN
jgi:4-diphosphocytidyl-2-C-methyl-D-erythritol kinase